MGTPDAFSVSVPKRAAQQGKMEGMFKSVTLSRDPYPDALVMGVFEGQDVSVAVDSTVIEASKRKSFLGRVGDLVEAYPSDGPMVLLAGLGTSESFGTDSFRRTMIAVGRRLASLSMSNVVFDFSSAVDSGRFGQVAGESLGILGWQLRDFKGTGSPSDDRPSLAISSPDEQFSKGLDYGLGLASSLNIARTLAATPPNVATPDFMASVAERIAGETGMTCRIIRGKELETEKLSGLITVGGASVNPPCLIRLEYRPDSSQATQASPIVLLGKTITYDTGGLSLKVNNGMVGMKMDKAGGCAVLGAMHAIATVVKPSIPVVGLLVAAENMVSSNSYRPDDVITYRNGVTVEVTNTDAEGRLVLADGLCWATEVEQAEAIIDVATLTGGVVTALGSTYAGYFANNESLSQELLTASEQSGDRIWRLPLHQEYVDMMKSEVADLVNSNPNRKAHPIQGAAFLQQFVPETTAWAHIDIAGVAGQDKESAILPSGPTGFGVRLLAEYLASR